jgi:hypothetical protein
MATSVTLLELGVAFIGVAVGILIGTCVTGRRGRTPGLPFDPRCRR